MGKQILTLLFLSGWISAQADYVRLKEGSNGNLYAAANWIGGVLPTEGNSSTGRVDGTEMPVGGTFWTPSPVYDFSLLQEGGLCVLGTSLNLRGGVTNETVSVPDRTLWIINDTLNDPAAFTNLQVATELVVWSHHGGKIELDLLRGHIEVGGSFRMVATDKGVVNIKDGILRSQGFRSGSGRVNMLAGGTAAVSLGRLDNADRNVVFNFETGNKGSITIAQTETGALFGTNDWQSLAYAGKLTVDGNPVGLEYFVLSNAGRTIRHIGALPGLTMVNGKLYKDGAAYRGIGVNYCDLFQAMLSFPEYPGQTTYRTLEGLRYLGENGIPFVRFWACGFWPIDWDLYFQDKAEWFGRMDLLVATAEEAGVGLIPDLFWRSETIPNLVDEYRDQWVNPDSQVRQFMSNYVAEVVDRYKDSPAIWGWEFANELSNMCDLPNWTNGLGTPIPSRGVEGISIAVDERNKMTYAIAEEAFNAFAAEVRKYDAHRFITTGNSRPRPQAWHNRMENNWNVDTYAQAKEALGWMAPTSSIDVASFHVYPYSMSASGVEPVYAEAVGVANILKRYREFCDAQGQAMFVGEYSSFYDGKGPAPEGERAAETTLLESIVSSGADLAAYWVFDRGIDRPEEGTIYPSTGAYLGVLDLILEYDAKMRGETHHTSAGVPVDWFGRFGLAPTNWQALAEIEQQDPNGNGMPLWQEYYAGTNPTNAGDVFAITGFGLLADHAPYMEWWGGTNGSMAPYVIESATNLADAASWQAVGSKSREEGTNTWFGLGSADAGPRFYRVLAVPGE